jgi:hypothetical protein
MHGQPVRHGGEQRAKDRPAVRAKSGSIFGCRRQVGWPEQGKTVRASTAARSLLKAHHHDITLR